MTNNELKKIANDIRKGIVTAVYHAKSGHPGGSLSAADILTYLYFEEMNIDPAEPKKADRDRICPAVLWDRGFPQQLAWLWQERWIRKTTAFTVCAETVRSRKARSGRQP